ncbi:MAG: enoyl-CoA hydratase/isomerase family protein [Mycobacterium sp.]
MTIDERRAGAVAWLTFDRADRLNAFTGEGYRELRTTLDRHRADDETRVVVLTGRGRAFSVGADRSLLDPSATGADRQMAGEEFARLLDVLGEFEKPLFAAVNGLAVGFGATMLMYCDVVLLAETARLRLPFTELGIVPEAGSSALLPTRVRWADAMWSVLSSEWIDAAAAVHMGLALRAAPDSELIDAVARAAARVAALDPSAVAATKRLMTAGRADAARAAITRELAELRALSG